MSSKATRQQGWKILRSRSPERAVDFDPEPETICYRGQTLAIVRHFFEISCQLGRLPSILGREFFRAKVSHHGIPSFEDQALFTHDVERALQRLDDEAMEVITLGGAVRTSPTRKQRRCSIAAKAVSASATRKR